VDESSVRGKLLTSVMSYYGPVSAGRKVVERKMTKKRTALGSISRIKDPGRGQKRES